MTTSTKLPGTAANNNAVGTIAWEAAGLNNIKSDVDGLYAYVGTSIGTSCRDKRISLIKADGSIGTTNKANTSTSWPTGSSASASYGSTSDLWGEASWSAEDINDSDFGVVLSVNNNANPQTNYLVASNFGFSVPSGATINGITVEINRFRSGALNKFPYVDYIKISVDYTASGAAFVLHNLSMTGCGI